MKDQTDHIHCPKKAYSLLSKTEFLCLSKTSNYGKLKQQSISKSFEYKMRFNIRKKIRIFLEKDLPLLIQNNYIALQYYNYNIPPNIVENIENNSDLVRKRSRDRIPLKAPNLLANIISKNNTSNF